MTPTTATHRYFCKVGDEETTIPDELYLAQDWMKDRINELMLKGVLPQWRVLALRQMVDDMPRAGFSFTVGERLVSCERVRL